MYPEVEVCSPRRTSTATRKNGAPAGFTPPARSPAHSSELQRRRLSSAAEAAEREAAAAGAVGASSSSVTTPPPQL